MVDSDLQELIFLYPGFAVSVQMSDMQKVQMLKLKQLLFHFDLSFKFS